jgi:AcrR family transcriptional regulator
MAAKAKAPSTRAAPNSNSGIPHRGVHPEGRKQTGGIAGEEAARELGRERVIEIQRRRLLSALFEVSAERGAGNVAVAHVVERAGVSRRTFYELFADREECFLAGFDDAMARVSRYVLGDYDPRARWAERLRTALTGLLTFLTYERGAGQLLVVGSLGAGPRALERRRRVLAQIITVVDQGRSETKSGHELPPLTAEGVVGGAMSVLHTRLLTSPPPSMGGPHSGDPQGNWLQELTGPLMSMIVLPYLGPAAARRELARPVPRRRIAGPAAAGDPLRDVGMRLTYRTVRVLTAVAANPGASNREVGLGAGMEDQGQISKLLARLQRLQLIQNTRSETARGAPNAWGLTERGWDVQRAIAGQPPGG